MASVGDERKGLADFIRLADLLHNDEEIILVGLNEKQIVSLPKDKNIRGIRRTENQQKLAKLYSMEGDVLDAEKIQEDWFPETNVDIFISHSHRNCPDLIELANKMEQKGLSCFIDSITWGYADDLLNQLDKSVCYKKTILLITRFGIIQRH